MTLPLSYNWRNLFVRRLSTSLTLIVVTTVVLVLAILLSFAAGIQDSLSRTGSPLNIIVLKPGATAESTSIVTNEESQRLTQTPALLKSPAGDDLISYELCTQTSIPRVDKGGALANVAVRGVDDVAFDVHTEIRIAEGRRFRKGGLEAIVGRAASGRYVNLKLGQKLQLGKKADREYEIVGIFEAGGGALESEIWAARTMISDSYGRSMISSAALRVGDIHSASKAIEYIRGPTVRLEAKQETTYYAELSKTTRDIWLLTSILISIMALGAAFAIANTMYAAVDARRREIAMLRTIGFSRSAVVLSFLIESILISCMGCALGLIAGYAVTQLRAFRRQDFLSDTTWTVLAYELKLDGKIAAVAFGMAFVVGSVGALAPAWRASRIHIIDALRKA